MMGKDTYIIFLVLIYLLLLSGNSKYMHCVYACIICMYASNVINIFTVSFYYITVTIMHYPLYGTSGVMWGFDKGLYTRGFDL